MIRLLFEVYNRYIMYARHFAQRIPRRLAGGTEDRARKLILAEVALSWMTRRAPEQYLRGGAQGLSVGEDMRYQSIKILFNWSMPDEVGIAHHDVTDE